MMYSRPAHFASPRHQRGIATILIMMLVGLGLTATTMGVMHSVKSTQQKQLAVHAATHSQAGAWVGVEIFRRYLNSVDKATVDSLALNTSIEFPVKGTATATIKAGATGAAPSGVQSLVNVLITGKTAPVGTAVTDFYQLTAKIRFTDVAAKSSSNLEVVYQYFPFSAAATKTLGGVLDFYDDLSLSGNVNVLNQGGGNSGNFNVMGNISLDNISVSGLNTLQATGNVTIGSAVSAQNVYANGNVILKGGANVNQVSALGGIELQAGSGARANNLFSNGDVILAAADTQLVNTRGNIIFTGYGTQGELTAMGNIGVSSWAAISQINSLGTTTLTTTPTVGTINSNGNVTCAGNWWSATTSIKTAGVASNCQTGSKLTEHTSVNINVIAPLAAFTMQRPVIDVWKLQSTANYIFEYVNNKMQVTVTNINGLADGVYYIGNDGGNRRDYLCVNINNGGNCTAPTTNLKTICQGFSASNNCFSYNNGQSTWTIDGKNLAPGIMWFKGNLKITNGIYYNTFLASGNIDLLGNTKVYASNYAGYTTNCSVSYPADNSANFSGLYPTSLCDISNGKMKTVATGNIGVIAGGYNPADNGTFSGGNIGLSASGGSNEVFGTVVAGDYLIAGNSTVVHGYVSAVNTTNSHATPNKLGNSTTIDLTNLPSDYHPETIPTMDDTPSANTAADKAKVLWSRYL